jgi:hypothetical protein
MTKRKLDTETVLDTYACCIEETQCTFDDYLGHPADGYASVMESMPEAEELEGQLPIQDAELRNLKVLAESAQEFADNRAELLRASIDVNEVLLLEDLGR